MTIHTPSGTFRTAVGLRQGIAQADIAILTHVFNDWESLGILIAELDTALGGERGPISLVVVDDGSDQPAPSFEAPRKVISDITVIRLVTNQGHQGALDRD